MKMKRSLLLWILLLTIATSAFAQTKQITGKITDNNGAPLSGVSILTDKKARSSISKPDGTYVLNVDNSTTLLVISYVGYVTQTIPIGGRSSIDVSLVPSDKALDDVVVIGYGTQRKSHLTGAIAKYSNEKLDEIPVTRLDQALQGKIAGVSVQNLTPEAGGEPRIRVRGLNSINAGADPLVVVDGHPVPDGLAFVNMADVQSVEVLKDAASAAIYGSRGASGVILVTTRSGKSEKTKYTVKLSSGIRSPYKTQDMMTVSDYVRLLFAEAAQRQDDPSVPAAQWNRITNVERAQFVIEDSIMKGVPFDWQKEGVRNNAKLQNVQLNVSGGRKEAKYYFSGAYQKEEGMMYKSNYEKISIRGKFENQLGKRVKLNINLNPTFSTRERPANNYIDFVRFPSYMAARHTEASAAFVNQVAQWASIRPGDWAQPNHFNSRVYSGLMPDGSRWTTTSASNPFSSSNNNPKSVMDTRDINTNEYRMLSTGDLTVNILKGLDFKTTASAYVTYSEGLDFAQTNNNRQGDVNRGIFTSRLFVDILNENTLNYSTTIRDHEITAVAGFTSQRTSIKRARTEATQFPSEFIRSLNTALQVVAPTTDADGNPDGSYTFDNKIGLLSYLGRATYAFKDKYLASASLRADGSSYFAPGKKWGYFPSASVGWVVSKEAFMNDIRFISNLKLRGSYGVSGNNRIVDFAFVDLLFPSAYAFGNLQGSVVAGQSPNSTITANPNITWERTFQYNIGADISLFKNAVSMSIEAYKSKSDQLLLRQASLAITGAPQYWNNIGKVQNTGVELEVSTNNFRRKDFKWTTSLNFSTNRNQLLDFGGSNFVVSPGGEGDERYLAQVGGPAIQFFGLRTNGVWISQEEADAALSKETTQWGSNGSIAGYYVAGGLKYVDINGDGKITFDDRTVIGNPFPDFTWGINNNLSYKAFDLTFLVQGVQGVDVLNGDGRYNESRRYNRKYVDNRWVSPKYPGDGKTPYFTTGIANAWTVSDYSVEDGSYFAVREIVVGYRLPAKVASLAKMSSLRIYGSVQNAYVHWAKSYRGINPEARTISGFYSSPLVDGYQRGAYPMPRTFMLGLDINF